ncbi:MAG: phosphoribosylamine--glycine ligase [Bacteroidia bacterium]
MNILLLGAGGREHALAWKILQSADCGQLYIAPGNAGTNSSGVNLDFEATDFEAIAAAVKEYNIALVISGPEQPLAEGLVDYFRENEALKNIPVFGPDQAAARLESSKSFAKHFMQKYNIPTAEFREFQSYELQQALEYIDGHELPVVIKVDGLAGGKGVIIPETGEEARQELINILEEKKFGQAGNKVVIEQFLSGRELSVFVLTDGKEYVMMPTAKDYKRLLAGDKGPNTGGMGAVSPVPFADAALMQRIEDQIVRPTLEGIRRERMHYRGFLYFGLMEVEGRPFVIEYNVRLGDPEAEVVVPRIKSDLLSAIFDTARGALKSQSLEVDPRNAITVMLVSGGYPASYEKGKVISGLEKCEDCLVFHAGTKNFEDKVITNGGRVLSITALADTLEEARKMAYREANKIDFANKEYREDIGNDLLN